MKRFFTFLKTELKLSLRDMNMPIFAVIMPLVIFIILGIIYGTKPAYDGAEHTFLEQTFGAAGAIAICASGLMGLPQAVSGLRELKILKRFRVTPVSPVFLLGVELSMYIVYCIVSLATLAAAALLWGVRLHGSLLAFLGSWALTMLSTLSIGMLVGGVAKDVKQASVIASILYFPMLVFSGTTLPIEVMPPVMQKIVSVFPLTQGITMMKHTFWASARETFCCRSVSCWALPPFARSSPSGSSAGNRAFPVRYLSDSRLTIRGVTIIWLKSGYGTLPKGKKGIEPDTALMMPHFGENASG